MTNRQRKAAFFGKRLLKAILLILVVFTLLLGIGWYFLRSDSTYVIQHLQKIALEKWNTDLDLGAYSLRFTEPFPNIKVELNDLSVAAKNANPSYPVLKINQVESNINPWDLVMGDFETYPFQLDSVWIHIYKDSLDQSNLAFDQNPTEEDTSGTSLQLKEFPSININYLDFHHQNDFKKKWQRAKLSHLKIFSALSKNENWLLKIQSDCHFDGLVFNKNGDGFLMNKHGRLDLNIGLANQGKKILLDSSVLLIDQNRFDLEGSFLRSDNNRIKLQISNDAAVIKEVLPLLSEKVNIALKDIKVDQPIKAKFALDELMVPGRKGAMQVDFEIQQADVQFKELTMTKADIKGYYSNDCDRDGIGSKENSCIAFTQLDGDFYDVLPSSLSGVIDQLDDPQVDAVGKIAINLPRLNPLLKTIGKVTFLDGRAALDFKYQGNLVKILSAPFDEQNIKMNGRANFENVSLDVPNRNEPIPSLSGELFFNDQETFLEELSLGWMGSAIELSGKLNNLPEFLFFEDQALNGNLRLHFDQLNLNKFIDQSKEKKQAAPPLNYQQIEKIAKAITSNINGSIKVEIDELIYDTLYLTDLKTQLKLFSPLRPEYSDSSLINIDQLSAKFMGEDPIFIDLGLSRDQVSEVQMKIDLPSVGSIANVFLPKGTGIIDGNASLDLMAGIPLSALLNQKNILPNLKYKGLIVFDQMDANVNTFSWPVKKMSGGLKFNNDQAVFDDLHFNYEGSPFTVNGLINNYAVFNDKDKKAEVDLHLRGTFLDFKNNEKRTLKNEKTANDNIGTTALVSPAQLFRDMDTIFQLATGTIDVRLDSILTLDHTIKPFVLKTSLLPDEINPDHHQILIDSFNLGFGKDNNIRGFAHLSQPDEPKIAANFEARMTLDQMGEFLPSDYLEMKGGHFKLDMDYKSILFDTINAENYLLKAEVDGAAEIINGKIFYNYRDFAFDDIYTHLSFDNRSLYIRDLDLKANGNRLFADGQSIDFFPFFILPDRRAKFDLDVATLIFDFGGFTAPHGLGKDTIVLATPRPELNTDSTINVLSQTVSFVDQLLDKSSLNMNTDFKELVYREFVAGNVSGNISLQPDTVRLSDIKMDVANGELKVDGAISGIIRHQPSMKIAVQMRQNDMSEIFRQFENFGQDNLGYKNMEGIASSDIRFSAKVNSNYSILPETMYGDMRVKLTGGQLKDVGALKKVTGFLSRKRRLDNIIIDTLETFTHIRGNDLYIDQFYLHSSSFDFGVEGRYSLGEDNQTRILFAVPISNLFRRHLTKKEMKSGKSKRKGMRVFIEAREKKDRMRFFLKIPFNRKKYRLEEEEKKVED